MSARPIIRLKNISKAYQIYAKPMDMLLEVVTRSSRHDEFWALRDISLEIMEGQRVGIMGANGSGKTTLLRIVTGNLTPSSGEVMVNGTVSSMLSLTSFLLDNESGLENIRFNLRLKGIPKQQIPSLTEEIIDFTELGSFIYAPVKTYSSGMHARLAFAISTVITPDVLVVDEVLGVGDAYFVGKATQRMIELCSKGRALLYVSHSLSALQMLCDKGLWLDKGTVRLYGPIEEVVKCYEQDYRRSEDEKIRARNREKSSGRTGLASPEELREPDWWRMRLVPEGGGVFHDTHYVALVKVQVAAQEFPVSLELTRDQSEVKTGQLDVLNSEWGRIFEKNGRFCRLLETNTGRRRGGHVLVRRPHNAVGHSVSVQLTVNYTSEARTERLSVEYIDERTGEWRAMAAVNEIGSDSENDKVWHTAKFAADITVASGEECANAAQLVERLTSPDVRIVDAYLLVAGDRTERVRERIPFQIIVTAEVVRVVSKFDIGVRIIRSDGVYIFWQSSGQSGNNIIGEPGIVKVAFDFNPNLLAAGNYQMTVYAANGWDAVTNYPYSEVFDRKVNLLGFTVYREDERIDFGAINQLVPTRVISNRASEDDESSIDKSHL